MLAEILTLFVVVPVAIVTIAIARFIHCISLTLLAANSLDSSSAHIDAECQAHTQHTTELKTPPLVALCVLVALDCSALVVLFLGRIADEKHLYLATSFYLTRSSCYLLYICVPAIHYIIRCLFPRIYEEQYTFTGLV